MKNWLLLGAFVFGIASSGVAQNAELTEFNRQKAQTSKRSMYALGGWAVANFAVSGAMVGYSSGSEKYFHQMNITWNVVNAGLAGLGLLGSRKEKYDKTPLQSVNAIHNSEKIYLLNAGLDVGYIFGGLYMTELANGHPDREDMFRGFGQSIILQGSFLLVLDSVMYFIYKGQRKNKLQPILENLDIGLTGFRLRF